MIQSFRVIRVGQKSLIGVFKHFFPGFGFCVDHTNVSQCGFVKEVELGGETREMIRQFVFLLEIILGVFGSEIGMNFTVELQCFMVVGFLEKIGRKTL
jgi:hypothetical protein